MEKKETKAARKIISIDDKAVYVLKEWKKRQEEYENFNFVISYIGVPLGKSVIGRIIKY